MCNSEKYSVIAQKHGNLLIRCNGCNCQLEINEKDFYNDIEIDCYCDKNTTRKSRTTEYVSWICMKERCYNKNHNRYRDYGGRGITVCERWLRSFDNFLEDMGKKPSKNFSLDRIDVNGNYCPENCRWADSFTQANNTRRNVYIEYNGETKTLAEWARQYNLKYSLVKGRLDNGWTIERALTYNHKDYKIPELNFDDPIFNLRTKNINEFYDYIVNTSDEKFRYSFSNDLSGKIFGSIEVICRVVNCRGKNGISYVCYLCKCSCGNYFIGKSRELAYNKITSCGCGVYKIQKETLHGMQKTKEYRVWCRLKRVCNKIDDVEYPKFGGKGITFCEQWNDDFISFFEEVGTAPSDDCSLYRIDESKGYEPGNCIWESRKGKSRDTKTILKTMYKGKEITFRELAKLCDVPSDVLRSRIHSLGWDVDKAMQTAYIKQSELIKEKQTRDEQHQLERDVKNTYEDFADEIIPIELLASTASNLIGKKFGKLEVVALMIPVYSSRQKKIRWLCKCDCGNYIPVIGNSLKTGHTTNCGCVRKEKISSHKMIGTMEYDLWNRIKKNCYLPTFATYHRYGGKGIKMDERWRESFEDFISDIGKCPSADYVFARIDETKDFCKENCYWKKKK